MMLESVAAAWVLGVMGAGHCLGMCGGIASALAFAVPEASRGYRVWLLLCYNLGRALSYASMGCVAGYVGSQVSLAQGLPILRLSSALLLIAMGLYLANWWMGLRYLEKLGLKLWRLLQPLGNKLFPVTSWYNGILLGMVWGWLPCGLVYSALAYSATQSGALAGAAVMLSFALGTTPAVLGGGLAANTLKRVLQHRGFRAATGILFMAYGLWILISLFAAEPHQHHLHHH